MFARWRRYSYLARREARRNATAVCSAGVGFFLFYLFITTHVVAAYRIQADSMQPTLSAGDCVLASSLFRFARIKRGDLVLATPLEKEDIGLFKRAMSAVLGFASLQLYRPFGAADRMFSRPQMCRVVGLPGDTVYMRDFVLYVKPHGQQHFLTEFEVSAVSYDVRKGVLPEHWSERLPFSGFMEEMQLDEHSYFVLCDNRIVSSDSRLWGAIDGSTQIKAKAFMRYFPFGAFGVL